MEARLRREFDIVALRELERRLEDALQDARSDEVWTLVDAIETLDRDYEF